MNPMSQITNNKDNYLATYREIVTQPHAWQAAVDAVAQQAKGLRDLWREGNFSQALFTGCGSSYYLSIAASAVWQSLLPVLARAVPSGELWLYPEGSFIPAGQGATLLIAVSRSGTTSETVAVTERFQRDGQGKVVVITTTPDVALAALGDVTVTIPEAQEESVAQTRSFAAMYLAAIALVATLAGRDDLQQAMTQLPAYGQELIGRTHEVARTWGEKLELARFYFLGSGPRYGLACEANLKMKEMTLSDSEPFHFFEFRHGPMSMVGEQTAIIGLVSLEHRTEESRVLEEMKALGGQVFRIAPDDGDVSLDCDLPDPVRNVLYLPALQLMAYYRAVAKGLNPDRPANLRAVVTLDLQV
jgi:glutamine---fructose-6-phosphate transaminase (isomerizing)